MITLFVLELWALMKVCMNLSHSHGVLKGRPQKFEWEHYKNPKNSKVFSVKSYFWLIFTVVALCPCKKKAHLSKPVSPQTKDEKAKNGAFRPRRLRAQGLLRQNKVPLGEKDAIKFMTAKSQYFFRPNSPETFVPTCGLYYKATALIITMLL